MNAIALSDNHGLELGFLDLKGIDVCIIAGDIAPIRDLSQWGKRKQAKWMNVVFCSYVHDHPETEFVFVAGNHDFWGEKYTPYDDRWPKNAHYLKNSGCTLKGVSFWGSPNIPYIGKSRRWAFETSSSGLADAFSRIPENLDVLITHSPPRISGSDIDSSGVDIWTGIKSHFGSKELYGAISTKRPKYAFCGHIHTGDHNCTMIGNTKCHNVSLLDEGYRFAYDPLKIEIA